MPWRHADGVLTLNAFHLDGWAKCAHCEWRKDGFKSHEAARKSAHRHVRRSGHMVSVAQMRQYTYAEDLR